ncbi:hypothetical protein HBI56_039620 [Parastagonospora nodorum]|uniref:Uncharacterized protein n=1 Tax=Phaeosphaeria nodorum (strain SN15 / ATCC MYA-4574 / FGSC 10173) TaxID=321614 RepID=A0A7U2HZ39_PHANO|nr:hypothetical protein HBH56_067170 [Parastagonospora nodorum]QRC93402.1 hypothetical protein JI435_403770 [Parastagonospora nodorum SN15]KAH3932733.1 hypothetical protein HBH54_080940 [Parastagonospora nodorum]KAH3955183.1 hypothetical protein HBH53_013460 [Parastagonospora nodorum]KAH3986145.1 hypothetical protein HBH52_044650 [Parastagonospora nodorum]
MRKGVGVKGKARRHGAISPRFEWDWSHVPLRLASWGKRECCPLVVPPSLPRGSRWLSLPFKTLHSPNL